MSKYNILCSFSRLKIICFDVCDNQATLKKIVEEWRWWSWDPSISEQWQSLSDYGSVHGCYHILTEVNAKESPDSSGRRTYFANTDSNNLHICLASRRRKSKWEAIGMAQEKCTCLWETAHGLQHNQDKNLKYWLSFMLHQAALCHAVSHLTWQAHFCYKT